jgi:putative thioredoxin
MNPADSHGAVDLTAHSTPDAHAPAAEDAGLALDAPLIATGTEENFQDVVAVSQTVPVIAVMWSGRSLESKPMITALEELAREYAGRFQLVSIDIDANPQIAQAFQIQGVPSVVALIAGRPLPLFQGAAGKEQVRPIIDQVLEAAGQMGITGRIAVSAEQTAEAIPPEHEAPLAAEEAGDLRSAIAAWERIIERNPRDGAARTHLSRVRLASRAADADASDRPPGLICSSSAATTPPPSRSSSTSSRMRTLRKRRTGLASASSISSGSQAPPRRSTGRACASRRSSSCEGSRMTRRSPAVGRGPRAVSAERGAPPRSGSLTEDRFERPCGNADPRGPVLRLVDRLIERFVELERGEEIRARSASSREGRGRSAAYPARKAARTSASYVGSVQAPTAAA